ncbi:nuclear transport factor 2 family protein [Pontimicrobium aquaticum]|uniref:nuclear transport factor 2 family protein n=1 Tax=Pontimicrobium aquaticum TaxID=2565367 RepID=UPI00145D010C|nr:nuclear transport factor 2 family protein [Pontimicrobium aquaticum]
MKTIWIIIFSLSVISCNKSKSFSLDKETAKILKMHHAQREYHFNKDSIAFANQLSKNFISVNKGEISKPTKEATIARYNNYFSSVEFVKWDDVSEPLIKFSDDGTLAYTIVDKVVTITYKNENDSLVEEETRFAWTAIYKKYGDEWKIDHVASTNKPSVKTLIED